MPLSDIVAAALSRPAGRVVDGPVRTIVHEVLQDRGFAGPAEVAELRDQVRVARAQVDALGQRLAAAEARTAALDDLVASLRKELSAAVEAGASVQPAEPVRCGVPQCEAPTLIGAFCVGHDAAWRAGQLPGFVGPEGHVQVGERAAQVAIEHAGQPYQTTASGRVKVGGKVVRKRVLPE